MLSLARPPPRVTSLVYRGEPRTTTSHRDYRPRPNQQDDAIEKAFEKLNGVGPDSCWFTNQSSIEKVHMLPHVESECARLSLWIQLMELVPIDAKARNKWKVSTSNLLPLCPTLHKMLADGKKRRALIRPVRDDLHTLVRVLEAGLCADEVSLQETSRTQWRPDWRRMVQERWGHKITTGPTGMSCEVFRYQLDIFDLKARELAVVTRDTGCWVGVNEVSGRRSYPLSLITNLETLFAPLCILTMTAFSVSQLSYFTNSVGKDRWLPSFLEDLEVMSYVVEIMSSDSPDHFRHCARPHHLDFERPPAPPTGLRSTIISRKWPEALWPETSKDGKMISSSSPVKDGKAARASGIYGPLRPLESCPVGQMQEDLSDRDDDKDGSDGQGGGHSRQERPGDRDSGDPSKESETGNKSAEDSSGNSSMNSNSSGMIVSSTLDRESDGSPLTSQTVLSVSMEAPARVVPELDCSRTNAGHQEKVEDESEPESCEWDEGSEEEYAAASTVDLESSEWKAAGEKLEAERLQIYRELAGDVAKAQNIGADAVLQLVLHPTTPGQVTCSLVKLDKMERARQRQWERWASTAS